MAGTDRPLVTIVIPTYNRANGFLLQALNSALQQTYTPLEIIVSDNCSTDHTPELMEDYTDDPRVRYIRHSTNLGAQGNFNFCVEAAEGDFFLMLHDDDHIDNDFVATCMEAVEQAPGRVGYVRTGVRLVDEDGKVIESIPNGAAGTTGPDAVLAWMRYQNFWSLSSTLYETAALREVGGFSENEFPLTCDCYATIQIALREGGIELKPVKAGFRKHEGTLTSHTVARRWIDEWYRFYKRTLEFAPSSTLRDAFKVEGGEFFSKLAYNYAEQVPSVAARWRTYALVYSKFGGKYLPPPLRKKLRAIKRRMSRIISPASQRQRQAV